MSIEVRPTHLQCNLSCKYCYQEYNRSAENIKQGYDLEAIKETIENSDRHFVLSGGEPLLAPKEDLWRIWKWGYEKYGENGMQTNGVLIDEDHILMFKKYNVSVGISIDGPGELNSLRWAGDEEKTREHTETIMENFERLLDDPELSPGVIVTLHKANAGSQERLDRLKEFIIWLEEKGLSAGYIHFLVEPRGQKRSECALSEDGYRKAFIELAEFMEDRPQLKWKPFDDFKKLLRGHDDEVLCIWNKCDPFTTSALDAVHHDGSVNRCARLYKEGIAWEKTDEVFYERQLSLYQTPQEMGGCKDCRFFLLCGASCPSRSINDDWRNKAADCGILKTMFNFYEKKLQEDGESPITTGDTLPELEEKVVNGWKNGQHFPVKLLMDPNKDCEKYSGIATGILLTPGRESKRDKYLNCSENTNQNLTEEDVRNNNWSPLHDHADDKIHIDDNHAHIDSAE